jgi:hypothetical protein
MIIERIITRFAAEAGKPEPRFARDSRANVTVSNDGRSLYSYGSHFVLATIMPDSSSGRSWWLVNGDTYSVSTSRHQSETRAALTGTGLPVLIVPFSALTSAGIVVSSIRPVHIRPDRFEYITHSASTVGEVPAIHRWQLEGYSHPVIPFPDDGKLHWETSHHWLGDSVFTADYQWSERNPGYDPSSDGPSDFYLHHRGNASFLSSFDYQERRPLYFLCQLPGNPVTVADAIESLKPSEVVVAAGDTPVTRQGDVFAIPAAFSAGQLKNGSFTYAKAAYVLGVNHTASEVIVKDGVTYARGVLRHKPQERNRAPEHRMQKMGDGKTWHILVRNTVPAGRAWAVQGGVD